jgi:6-pyruvoyl-tetrahydropterin synthase
MTTHFISAEIEINETQEAIAKTIEQALAQHGKPLRWAIAAVESNVDVATNVTTRTAHVEAIVTRT